MKVKITPSLYRVEAISSHDTITAIFTDANVAGEYESGIWDYGGIVSSTIYYADESIDGAVDWIKSAESIT